MKHSAANRSQHLRRSVSVLFRLMMAAAVVFAFLGCASAQTAVTPSGSGTEADPYQITVLGNLVWMSDTVASSPGKYYKMMNDIDASETAKWDGGKGFVPIGRDTARFEGVFDGNNKKITGLTINRPDTDSIGLFGRTYIGSMIKNLGLEDFTIVGGKLCGGLAGGLSALSSSTLCITNCYTSGSVSGSDYCGGLVGYQRHGFISNCYSTGNVSGSDYCGGLIGSQDGGSISKSYSSGSVSGSGGCGGLIGSQNGGSISKSYSSGDVSGNLSSGGLVGYQYGGPISNCYSTGRVSGNYRCGGLVGALDGGSISNCYSTGIVSGYHQCGGLVGYQSNSPISNCYSTGSVSGNMFCGGLVGSQDGGSISNCYSTGSVSGGGESGGLVGDQIFGTKNSCYYDRETSGQSDTKKGVPKTTAEMKQQATFSGWDFENVWKIVEGASYPYLSGFGREDCDLTLSVVGTGTIVPGVGVTSHSYGTVVSLSAVAADNYTFGEWLGGPVADPTSSNTIVVMDSSKSVAARFRKVYEIRTLNELQAVNDDLDGHYILMNDIDASETASWNGGKGFVPIGSYTARFEGVFDGNNKKITGLTINRPDRNFVGLFGKISNSTIKNLGMENFTIVGYHYCGGLVGSQEGGFISNCYSSGSVSGYWYCGGLVGRQEGFIGNCYSTGRVRAESYCGGLVGEPKGFVSGCYYDTEINGQSITLAGTPKTTAEMKQRATFAGWDFATIWGIKEKESYPYLLDLPPRQP